MADQPMPVWGDDPVTPVARDLFNRMLTEREAKGIATYGTTLMTHNGRDAALDAMEECIDLWQYLTQLRLEHADALVEIGDLSSRLEQLQARLAAVERERDEWGGKACTAQAEASAFRRQAIGARGVISLLNSMVLSGESHSDQSREAVRQVMGAPS